jgi:hypothetical protein
MDGLLVHALLFCLRPLDSTRWLRRLELSYLHFDEGTRCQNRETAQ